jgi:hypothetical protein
LHSASAIVATPASDAQQFLDPRLFHAQLRGIPDNVIRDELRDFPGANIPTRFWAPGGQRGRPADRMQILPDPDPNPVSVPLHNPSFGSPTKKTRGQQLPVQSKRVRTWGSWHVKGGHIQATQEEEEENVQEEVENMDPDGRTNADSLAEEDARFSEEETSAHATTLSIRDQIRALVTVYTGPLCLRVEQQPPSFVMQNIKVNTAEGGCRAVPGCGQRSFPQRLGLGVGVTDGFAGHDSCT